MQTPIPQSGPRGWPTTERRNRLTPKVAIAAATMVPGGMLTVLPFTRMCNSLTMIRCVILEPARSVGRGGGVRWAVHQQGRQDTARAQRRGNGQTPLTPCHPNSLAFDARAAQWQVILRCRA